MMSMEGPRSVRISIGYLVMILIENCSVHTVVMVSAKIAMANVKLTFLIDSAANVPIDRQLQDWNLFGKVLGQEEHGDNITVFQI